MTFTPFFTITLAFSLGATAAALVVPVLIAWQRRHALGQQIYEDGPASHAVKQGTPTMGGVAFAVAAIIGALVPPMDWSWRLPILCLVIAAAAIGFTDDYLKLIRQRALGLRARWKFGLLVLVAIGFVLWTSAYHPYASVWFTGFVAMPLWLWALLGVCAIVGAANAVNLTDGLDGLAAGTAIPPLLLMGFLFAGTIPAAVAGSCTGFLYYNRHPARIFIGDTGSLALGALLGGLAIEYNFLLLLPIIGIVFVIEALSVIAQVISFKTTGKRILKMSPLHHHLEMSGWPEQRITIVFSVVSFCATFGAYVLLLLTLRGSEL